MIANQILFSFIGTLLLIQTGARAQQEPVLVTISEKTTRITEPLKPSGYPDFLEAVNLRAKGNITPQANGALQILRAAAPDDLTEEQLTEFYRRLAFEPRPDDAQRLMEFENFLEQLPSKEYPPANREEKKIKDKGSRQEKIRERLTAQQENCGEEPWTDQECPLVANWLAQQTAALRHLDNLRDYPRAYLPLVRGAKDTSLVTANMAFFRPARTISNTLAIRGQRAVAAGQFDAAIDDLERIMILRGYFMQQPTMTNCLVGISIGNFSMHRLFNSIVLSLKLTPEQLQRVQGLMTKHDVDRLAFAQAIDEHERLVMLDQICRYAEYGVGGTEEQPESLARRQLFDYDFMLERCNLSYDRIVAVWQIVDMNQRLEASIELDEAQHKHSKEVGHPLAKALAPLSKTSRSRYSVDVLNSLAEPKVGMIRIPDFRDRTRRDLWQSSLALLKFRQEQNRFPGKIDELVPKYLAKVPQDYAGWQDRLTYHGGGQGFLLYSWDYDNINQQGFRGTALDGDFCDDQAVYTSDHRPKPPKVATPPRNRLPE